MSTQHTMPSVYNTIFLTLLGMFIGLVFLPIFLRALLRLCIMISILFGIFVFVNPNDFAFAQWIEIQEELKIHLKEENITTDEINTSNGYLSGWIPSLFQSVSTREEKMPLSWIYYNLLCCSVVFVHPIQQYAFGCCGIWFWVPKDSFMYPFCQHPWVSKVSRGGKHSSLEAYKLSTRASYTESDCVGLSRSVSSAVFTWMSANNDETTVSKLTNTSSFAALKERGLLYRSQKQWEKAYNAFIAAASVADESTNTKDETTDLDDLPANLQNRKINMQLEAAWCMVEDLDIFPSSKATSVLDLVQQVQMELSSHGFYNEAAQTVAQLGQRLRLKFLANISDQLDQSDETFKNVSLQIGELFVQASELSKQGNDSSSAFAFIIRAAIVYSEAEQWSMAEETFARAATMQEEQLSVGLSLNSSNVSSSNIESDMKSIASSAVEAIACTIFCQIAQMDVKSAKCTYQTKIATPMSSLASSWGLGLFQRGATTRQNSLTGEDYKEVETLLGDVLDSYDAGSATLLDQACRKYEMIRQLAPWQRSCLEPLKTKLTQLEAQSELQ